MASVDEFCDNCRKLPWTRFLEQNNSFSITWFLPESYNCWFCALVRKIQREATDLLSTDKREKSTQGTTDNVFSVWSISAGTITISNPDIFPFLAHFLIESAETDKISNTLTPIEKWHHGYALPIDIQQVNWGIVRSWIDACAKDSQHIQCEPADLTLDGFCLIDCLSRTVVPSPPGARYVALSYVWGSSTVDEALPHDRKLPDDVPSSIEDAMHCTKQLGFRYLWIDRYCIDQKSSSKHLQIQNMDQIYGCASITIVNAAGEDPGHGLPGVSGVARTSVASFFIGDQRLTRIPLSGELISKSKWARRGWTFQEELLSSRRLVFTASQVYFQCRKWFCHEYLPRALIAAANIDDDVQAFTLSTYGARPWLVTFQKLLNTHLSRCLTYDSDILIAFLAVLRSLDVDHFWGVPFRLDEKPSPEAALMDRLLWTAVPIKNTCLTLRDGFPTWSWTAWKNTHIAWGRSSVILDSDLETTAEIETKTGQRCSFAEYCSILEKDGNLDHFLPLLHVQGWMTSVQYDQDPKQEFWNSVLDLSVLDLEGRFVGLDANIMDVLLPKEPEWSRSQFLTGSWPVLILIAKEKWKKDGYSVSGLVLKLCKDGTYQRLGELRKATRSVEWKDGESFEIRETPKFRKIGDDGILKCKRCSITLS